MKRMGRIAIIVVCAIVAVVAAVCVGVRVYFRKPVAGFFNASEKAFKIPGLNDNYVPQGLHYDGDNDVFIMSAYSSVKDEASVLFIINAGTGELISRVCLEDEEGAVLKWHVGGVAVFKDYLYLAGSEKRCLGIFDYSNVLSCESGGTVRSIGSFSLKRSNDDYVKPSFVSTEGNRLIVGEFASGTRYRTLDSHKVVTPAGDQHSAVALEFVLSEGEQYGINPIPVKAYSIRDKVQGVCFNGGNIYMSTSLNFKHSYLYEYSEAQAVSMGEIELIGHKLPFYSFDSASHRHTYKLPPMAEEAAFRNGKIHVLFESACNKYILGKLASATWCYATSLEEMR